MNRWFFGLTFLGGVVLAVVAKGAAKSQFVLVLPLFWCPLVFGAYGFLAQVWPRRSPNPSPVDGKPAKSGAVASAAGTALGRAVPGVMLGLLVVFGVLYLPLWLVKSRKPVTVALVGCAFYCTPILLFSAVHIALRLGS